MGRGRAKVNRPAFASDCTRTKAEPPRRRTILAELGAPHRGRPVVARKEPAEMGLFTKDIETLNDLFVHQLKDIYYAEKRIVGALPKMIAKATSPELRKGFESHLEETRGHVKRLEQVFQMHGVQPESVTCPAIDGIIDEADEVSGEVSDKNVLDAALIASAQAVEHYEMTRYGTLVAWAKQLGRDDCASVLSQTLEEEKAADLKLTKLASNQVNRKAA